MMQKQVNTILQKRMDRKDFLKHVGMGMAVLTGFAGVVKWFTQTPAGSTTAGGGMSYGSSAYGGAAQAQKS